MRNYWEEIKEFYEYVWKFYNIESGLYKLATDERIQEAVNIYLESKPLGEFYFDSFDREEVRKILEPAYTII